MSVTHVPEADVLRRQDPELAEILLGERERQASTLQLIAAENFTSPAVLAALGSPLANKYAEEPEWAWTLACSAPNSALARSTAMRSATSTISQPPWYRAPG